MRKSINIGCLCPAAPRSWAAKAYLKADALPEVQKNVLFIDFDNTISLGDVLDGVIEKYSRTRDWEHWQTEWREGRISTLECLQRQMGDLAVDEATLLEHVRHVELDPGFVRLQAWAAATGTELLIVSDNFAPILGEILRHRKIAAPLVFANALAFSNGSIIPSFPFRSPDCPRCAHCKATHLARYEGYRTIYVGDGLSDTCPAMRVDLVFAKDSLARYLAERGKAFTPFANLDEVVAHLVAGAAGPRAARRIP